MIGLLTGLHVLTGLILILVVLLQSSQGGDIAGAFGGMGSQTALGPRGTTTLLAKATVFLAIVFVATSLSLGVMSNRSTGSSQSVLGDEQPAAATEPAAPNVEVEVVPPPGSTTAAPNVEEVPPDSTTAPSEPAPGQ